MRNFAWVLAGGFFLGMSSFSLCWADPAAKAVIVNTKGEKIGSASFTQEGPHVKLRVKVKGLTQGLHGMHVHGVGKCEAPDFKSAGPHFNPHSKQHGLHNPLGSHSGDLPNLLANKKGKARLTAVIKGANLQEGALDSLLKTEGTALVIHAGPDDEMSDPAGNSGDRIACGVIEKKGSE